LQFTPESSIITSINIEAPEKYVTDDLGMSFYLETLEKNVITDPEFDEYKMKLYIKIDPKYVKIFAGNPKKVLRFIRDMLKRYTKEQIVEMLQNIKTSGIVQDAGFITDFIVVIKNISS
jgi:hypothetical protein